MCVCVHTCTHMQTCMGMYTNVAPNSKPTLCVVPWDKCIVCLWSTCTVSELETFTSLYYGVQNPPVRIITGYACCGILGAIVPKDNISKLCANQWNAPQQQSLADHIGNCLLIGQIIGPSMLPTLVSVELQGSSAVLFPFPTWRSQ